MTNPLAPKSKIVLPLSGLPVAVAVAALCATPAPAASAPPELGPLLQKTSELQISSERFSGEVTITGKKLPSKLKALGGLKTKIAGEESTSPEAASLTETLLGQTITLRLVDKTLYIRDPSIAKEDGGLPWIKESQQGPAGGLFGSHTNLGGGPGGSGSGGSTSGSHFKTEMALLKASNDVRSLGASTIDGQAVTGFAGTANPREIEESTLPAKLRTAVVKSHIRPASTFEVFIAANGLPVRSHVVLALGAVKLNVTQDVLAINFPVAAIPAPPAAETITAAQLKKILAKRLKKKKKK
ncbi:MAG TPA: hypothetical protein VGO29_11060 [Solirubrobacteraceae bacterium]|jgi:hypothetical protein|nr:hypothetical protein [Solirubrobacteraceae bacterium]